VLKLEKGVDKFMQSESYI